jgi:hypothetical protein
MCRLADVYIIIIIIIGSSSDIWRRAPAPLRFVSHNHHLWRTRSRLPANNDRFAQAPGSGT